MSNQKKKDYFVDGKIIEIIEIKAISDDKEKRLKHLRKYENLMEEKVKENA